MGRAWRLIRDGDRDAAMNMAIDEAIMTAHREGRCPPTIRLYGWKQPSISIGYFQDISRGGIDLEYCQANSVDLVRRLTGGRAVLHGHDLTFSVVAAETYLDTDHRSILTSHRWLMGGIVAGFRLIGLDARLGAATSTGRPHGRSADCFAHAAACDVMLGVLKIAGSAQVRRHGVILEQGSIPLRQPDVEPSAVFRRQTGGVSQHLAVERPDLEAAVTAGFRDDLRLELTETPLSEYENRLAEELARNRFGSTEWTLRRNTTAPLLAHEG